MQPPGVFRVSEPPSHNSGAKRAMPSASSGTWACSHFHSVGVMALVVPRACWAKSWRNPKRWSACQLAKACSNCRRAWRSVSPWRLSRQWRTALSSQGSCSPRACSCAANCWRALSRVAALRRPTASCSTATSLHTMRSTRHWAWMKRSLVCSAPACSSRSRRPSASSSRCAPAMSSRDCHWRSAASARSQSHKRACWAGRNVGRLVHGAPCRVRRLCPLGCVRRAVMR